ncbi:TolC family protein [Dyadobacter sp. NIV53]|uniref:TolC family protein n=1 Tax=Dyadobacter sp. NIV53 TaxID=2861765 RepID=UPI001C86C577|nr:TolC family protein [Dyadobacter sp. NIV53]
MRLIILSICILACNLCFAQQHYINLEQSKSAALSFSKAIKNGQLVIESAEAGKKSAEANYLPSVSFTGIGLYGFKNLVGAMPPLLDKGLNNFYFAGVSANQAIYAGGKIRTANELAAMQVAVSRIRAKQSVDSVLLLTEQKYWNLVGLQEQHKSILANEQLLDQILKQQQDMLASGLIARNDMLKVKVKRSQLLLNKNKLENGRKIALLDFCLYIGNTYDSSLVMQQTLDTTSLPVMQYKEPELDLDQNDNYRLLQKSIEAEKLQTRLTKGDYLPGISLGLNAGQIGSINSGLGNNFIPVALGMVSVPISDWWGSGKQKMKQRQISERIAANNFSDGQNKLKVGIMKSWYDLTDALKQIVYAKENLNLAKDNLKVSRDNYSSGLSGITELLDAQVAYQQAESEQVSAYANYQDKEAAYRYITGKINESSAP